MKIQRPLRAIEFFAFLVRALEPAFDVVGTSPVVLLAAGAVPLTLEAIQVLIVKALYLEGLRQQVITVVSHLIYLREQRLILQIDVPVLVHVIQRSIIGWHLWEAGNWVALITFKGADGTTLLTLCEVAAIF
jgi:hypothetical protein